MLYRLYCTCGSLGGFFTYINFLATSWFLTIMSIDRCMSLQKSFREKRTFKNSTKVCGAVWLIAVVFTLPLVFLIQENDHFCDFKSGNDEQMKAVLIENQFMDFGKHNYDNELCQFKNPTKWFKIWQIAYFSYAYAIPTMILIFEYSKILVFLKNHPNSRNIIQIISAGEVT